MLRHCHTRRRHHADAETTERFPPRGDTQARPMRRRASSSPTIGSRFDPIAGGQCSAIATRADDTTLTRKRRSVSLHAADTTQARPVRRRASSSPTIGSFFDPIAGGQCSAIAKRADDTMLTRKRRSVSLHAADDTQARPMRRRASSSPTIGSFFDPIAGGQCSAIATRADDTTLTRKRRSVSLHAADATQARPMRRRASSSPTIGLLKLNATSNALHFRLLKDLPLKRGVFSLPFEFLGSVFRFRS